MQVPDLRRAWTNRRNGKSKYAYMQAYLQGNRMIYQLAHVVLLSGAGTPKKRQSRVQSPAKELLGFQRKV